MGKREPDPEHKIDLHGLTVPKALRRLEQELHACRVRGVTRTLVITGRGWGSELQTGKLAPAVRQWLDGPNGARFGVVSIRSAGKGGALDVQLSRGT